MIGNVRRGKTNQNDLSPHIQTSETSNWQFSIFDRVASIRNYHFVDELCLCLYSEFVYTKCYDSLYEIFRFVSRFVIDDNKTKIQLFSEQILFIFQAKNNEPSWIQLAEFDICFYTWRRYGVYFIEHLRNQMRYRMTVRSLY